MKNFRRSLLFPLFLLIGIAANAQEEEYGLASFYSDDFQGRKTAYGEIYDKDQMTGAHKKYPYGTLLKVTRLDNNKSVTIKVIDKGPYIKGRVVDLSRKAAEQLGLVEDGVARVKVELASKAAKETAVTARETPKPAEFDQPEAEEKPRETTVVKKEEKPAPATDTKTKITVATTEKGEAKAKDEPVGEIKFHLVRQDYNQYGLYKIVLQKPDQKGFGVQVASLSSYENVLKQVADLQAKWFDNILVSIEKGNNQPIYKVILGPFESEAAADNYKDNLKKKFKINGFVLNLGEIKY